ncbi:MAG: response regulator transcription factor [Syntrophomonadaceae bacterium]|nr:response regulator transcription factor [Syntrophomonadaceae bacterium]
MIKILIVEDEKPISDLIRINLSEAGYYCDCAFDGLSAAAMIDENKYDLILLDIMLPEADGYELMEYIRPQRIPVIFLTAKATVHDRVKGLKLGADDYLIKPFEIVELLARVEAVLRRYHVGQTVVEIGDVVVDTGSRMVKKENSEVQLTKKEYELLIFFIQNNNIALSRDTIYEKIWESDYMGDSRTVDLHVQRLRKKLGWENLVTAVYKFGYRLEIDNEAVVETFR